MADESLKESIITTVMDMLGEGLEAGEFTTRQIAKRAGVGVGLINYHFQTKENLVNIAVARQVDKIIDMTPEVIKSFEGTPKQKLKKIAKMTASYLAHNPSVSRISILRDLGSGSPADNTQRTFHAYEPLILEITGQDKYWSQLINSIFCFTFQSTFLRADVIKQTTGFDFFNDEQRDKFVDDTIETVLQNII